MAKGFGKKQKQGKLKRRDYLDFLPKVLWSIRENKFDITIKLIEENLEKIDHNFPSIFRDWATETLSKPEKDKAYERALDIYNFCKIIQDIIEIEPVKKSIYIEIAIVGYEIALPVFNQDSFPEIRAEIEYYLGNAYCDRISGGDWVQNLEKAIESFENASQFYYHEGFLEIWADIQNSLATAYSDYAKWVNFNKEEYLELAILCCKNALQVYLRNIYPEDWAMVLTNLGAAYRVRIQGDPTENLKKAICCYNAALQEHTYEKFLEDWAGLQNNLGNAYRELLEGEREKNLDLSLYHLNESLKVYTRESTPQDWAMAQHSLALTYYEQGQIDKAVDCFRLSLEIYTHTTLPKDCLECGCDLGNIAFTTKWWEEAIYGYAKAVDAVEQNRTWSTTESRRQEILETYISIYHKIVQACINAGQIDKAFEYSERSRSKRLVDLMASSHLSQSENIPPKVQELLQKYEELQQQIDIERQNNKSENNRSETRAIWQVYNEKIASLETAKQEIWEQLRREDPILAGEIQVKPLSLSEVQQLIDNPKTAILSFYTTNSDTHIFIITQKEIDLLTCIGEGLETLQNWIAQNWSLNYIHHPEKWENDMEHFLHELAERLQLSKIINQYLQDIEELIIEPHLLLHQIPFAALPTGEYQEYLVDRFLIRYTPSCQILDFCHQNHKKKYLNLDSEDFQYGTVADTLDNKPRLSIPCSRCEEEEIAKMYNIPSEKRLIGSSQATVKNFRKLAENVQTLHCCHHAISCLYNPLESQLNLGDGSITLGQLMSPGWRLTNLLEVFLSCCETNLDNPDITDNLLTLATGFLCAGAISVISSLWQVNDLATALFSVFYYQQRQDGKNRPEALKAAQIKLRELSRAGLKEISQVAKNERKQAKNQKKHYPQDSVEYLECDRQHQKYAKISIAINNIQKSKGEFPFAHPRYWSAFIAQGLQ
ncbi:MULTISPECIES: CHAT domain-containing protein [Nostocales]|uniref:CHAT domain-containing protein n=1 Tax=Dolichospermum flos-aquae UHCC 0037 TaxID=2590026 RepID=A0ACC7SD98_DOLFA|nr:MULTISPECIES: CHAT domain-containing tetratricopeptide repeat protein [Nostocales]MBO1063733.1 CHAT domain-containing protein [Anabaena sp. 54]MTJ46224.1 CHAT domain-containing protein [Dolichospermum flos-aquae UHCC 0037]